MVIPGGSINWRTLKTFNGAILMTTNCLVPLRKENTYLERLFTTGTVNYPGAVHIPDRKKAEKRI